MDAHERDEGAGWNPPIKHLCQEDLARRWRLSCRTLERWRWLGQGPRFLKIGGRVVYRIEDIEAFEAAGLRVPLQVLPTAKRG